MDEQKQQLMELVVDKVLKKHGVLENKISEIVTDLKKEVNELFEHAQTYKIENDAQVNSTEESATTETTTSKKIFYGSNDVKTVKTFL